MYMFTPESFLESKEFYDVDIWIVFKQTLKKQELKNTQSQK